MKTIPNFPNYTIDDSGVVKGKIFAKAQTLGKNGYRYVTLYSNNSSKKLYVHRLLAELFIPNPEGKRTVNHKDGDKTNNCLSNLEWHTDSENIQHAYDNGLNHGSKINDNSRENMYEQFMSGQNMSQIAEGKDFNNVTVSNHIRKYVKDNNLEKEYAEQKVKQKLARQCN